MHFGANRFGTFAAFAAAMMLCGCANLDLDSSTKWFAKPMDWVGRNSGYTYSELQETRQQRPITANDLVQENGACPSPPPVAQPQAPANSPAAASNPDTAPAVAPGSDSLLGGGIALGMSECDVVFRAGQPNSVQLGKNQNGARTAVLTYSSGPRPGIYRFEAGRLMDMDRVAEPAPQPTRQVKKKKPMKSAQAAKKNDQAQ